MKLVLLLVAFFLAPPFSAHAGSQEALSVSEISFTNDDLQLAGLVIEPAEGRDALTAVALIQGSGHSGRENLWARSFAESLARAGFSVLLPDKRGTPPSEGDWHKASFEDLAADAVAGLDAVRARENVRDQGGGFLGLSQGGHVAPLAGLRANDVDFVVDVSGSMVPMEDQLMHELEQAYLEHDLDWDQIGYLQEFARFSFDHLRCGTDESWNRYIERRREIANGPLAPAVASWPDDRDDPYWEFWGNVYDYDPLPKWRELVGERDIPALVIYGERDEFQNVPVQRSRVLMDRYLAPDPDFTYRIYEGSGHALYEPDEAVLRQEMVEMMTGWAQLHTSRSESD